MDQRHARSKPRQKQNIPIIAKFVFVFVFVFVFLFVFVFAFLLCSPDSVSVVAAQLGHIGTLPLILCCFLFSIL